MVDTEGLWVPTPNPESKKKRRDWWPQAPSPIWPCLWRRRQILTSCEWPAGEYHPSSSRPCGIVTLVHTLLERSENGTSGWMDRFAKPSHVRDWLEKKENKRPLFIVRWLFCCHSQCAVGSLLHSVGASCRESREHHSSSWVRFHPHCADQEHVPQEGYLDQDLRDVHCDLEVSKPRAYLPYFKSEVGILELYY